MAMGKEIHIFKFHPDTGERADDGVSAEHRQHGEDFYWRYAADNVYPWERCELFNFSFVCQVQGIELVVHMGGLEGPVDACQSRLH